MRIPLFGLLLLAPLAAAASDNNCRHSAPRSLALDLAGRVLRPGGDFLIKIFHGEGFDAYHKQVRKTFDKVQMRKPLSSRDRSREQCLLARGFRGM